MTSSRRSIVRSLTVYPAASAQPSLLRSRCRSGGADADGECPAGPGSSRSRAASSSTAGKTRGASSTNSMIMMAPPTNSASPNCQPISSHSTMPSSRTRLVLANMNTIDAVKSAPRWNSDFASALAA